MSNAIARATDQSTAVDPATILNVAVGGDLSKLSAQQQLDYYTAVCRSLGLNALTRPFGFIKTDGRVVLYALKDCAEQLRTLRKVSITKIETEQTEELITVTAYGALPDGRTDSDVGAVYIKGLKGDALSNARMKATTKAKRRLTLSICGLGMLDESEVSSIAGAQVMPIPAEVPAQTDQSVKVQPSSIGLDQWKCSRATAMELINVCKELAKHGVADEQMRTRLPKGVQSRKDLTEEQAQAVIQDFADWLSIFTNTETVEGEVVNA